MWVSLTAQGRVWEYKGEAKIQGNSKLQWEAIEATKTSGFNFYLIVPLEFRISVKASLSIWN